MFYIKQQALIFQFYCSSLYLLLLFISQPIITLIHIDTLFYQTMHHDPNTSPTSSKFISLSQQWNNLIKQFKSQSRPKVDLPPIIFQKKSPLKNYKNALKLHQSLAKKNTTSKRALQFFKKNKISTININEDVITKHSRPHSDNLYVLTEQQKQLLNSRQFHKHSLTDEMKRHQMNESKQSNLQQLMSQTQRDKQTQRISRKQLIRQIKIYHEQHVAKDKKVKQSKERVPQSSSNKKEKIKGTFSMELQRVINQKYSEVISNDNNHTNNTLSKREPFHKDNLNKNRHQNTNQFKFFVEKNNQQKESHHQASDQLLQNRNRKLSLQFSKDYKSLKYRYQKGTSEQYDDSIANMLIKNRKQKVQHIFSIFNPSKKLYNNNHSINSTNNNLTQSQRQLKLTQGNDQQQQQQYLQYRQYNNNQRKSQTQISQRNKTELITTAKNNSPDQSKTYSPLNKKRQENCLKGFTSNKNPKNNKLRLNIKKMEYEPWHDVLTPHNTQHHQSCNIDFTIENYYEIEENDDQQHQQRKDDDQLPKSKTVIIM